MASRMRMLLFILLIKSILCFSAASRYQYRIPSSKSPPFLDLEILHNNFDNLEDFLSVPFNKYRNNLQADTQRILGAIVAEVLESAYLDPKHLHWKKFVSNLNQTLKGFRFIFQTPTKSEQSSSPSPYFLSYQNYKKDRNSVFGPLEETGGPILKRMLPVLGQRVVCQGQTAGW